jgi:hypothetical protein
MPSIHQGLSHISSIDQEFVGTVALRNEKLTLPDGSKVAIGIDGDHWVIVYQNAPGERFVMYEFNASKKTVIVDKKPGSQDDIRSVKRIVNYFFESADMDDVVTIKPEEVQA